MSVVTRVMAVPERYDFGRTLGALAMGRHDPCARAADGEFWWATTTPGGAGTLRLRPGGSALAADAFGPGADWLLEHADAVAGLRDDVSGFADVASGHPVVARLAKVHSGVRLPAIGVVFPHLMRAILEQKVTGKEAYHGYAAAVRRFGEPAPGPLAGLRVPPDPARIGEAPYWDWHPMGVEQRRADTIRRAAAEAPRLQRCPDSAAATRRMRAIPGIGPWTAAEVVRIVYGDPDAVSVGDYHIPNMVAWALAGEPRADDARMLELLEPFAGHRGRVCELLAHAGLGAPRYGPRMPVRSFASY